MNENTEYEGLWQVVAAHGWRGTTMARIAQASGSTLGQLRGRVSAPEELIIRFNRMVDQTVLDGTVPTPGESPRDRLFDVLMRRLDVLQPHRAGITRFMHDLPFHPLLTMLLGAGMQRSMGWMLEAAGLSASGPAGLARIQGLTAVWVFTLRAWTKDESADLATTMAALDKALDRADQVARSLDRAPGADAVPMDSVDPDNAAVQQKL